MKLSSETKIFIGIFLGSVLLVVGAAMLFTREEKPIDKTTLLPKNTYTKGVVDAKVYLVEFSDFQCPACKSYKPYVDKTVEKYGDKIVFGYRHFPLPIHQFSFKAAEVSEVAGALGGSDKFWEAYEYLFQNQEQFSDEFLQNTWKALGLDEKAFVSALSSGKYRSEVDEDMSSGTSLSVNSTPTFFLNGKKLTLSSYNELEIQVKAAIDQFE